MSIREKINTAYDYILPKSNSPQVGLILGSGLGGFADTLENSVAIPFGEIPDFPQSTVEGHSGAFIFGNYGNTPVAALKGRLHYYEGYSQQEITMPVRIMSKLGIKKLIITNAAGGINQNFKSGVLMLISDHINYSFNNPLMGANLDEFGARFPDATDIYTKTLRENLKSAAKKEGIDLYEGVYTMYSGPNYETPAEIRFLRTIGSDAVGMSTVPEALVAAHCGIQVIGISCITNMAAGILDQKLNHQEVLEVAEKVREQFTKVLGLAIDTQE